MKIGSSLIAILCLSAFGFTSTALAFDFGVGTGCSPIEGVEALSLTNGDTFVGRIGSGAVSGFNKNGKPVDNADGDAYTDSMEECINDALHGYCTTVFGFDTNLTVTFVAFEGKKNQKSQFRVTFDDTSGCATSQCSDHADNDTDGTRDFGGAHGFLADTDCSDYNDNSES